ncbi:MAG: xanthine dehydrogenase accessory factor [Rubrobacteraceae bacterium]|nr:xanthine dehydrogenase accessory factor [Rubrobacteraceae bacterium]
MCPDGSMEGWVGGGCIQPTARREGLAALHDGEPRLVRISPDTAAAQPNVRMAQMTCASEGTADLYVEPCLPRPTLVAAGSSPLVDTLAALAPPLGFRFVRLENAAELNVATVPYPRDSWMVVATFGEFDEGAVEAGVRLGLPYVGLVASERRAGTVLSELRARGFGGEALEAVRSPAGLPIGADSQEEIALSIMAEIVSLRAKLHHGLSEEPVVRTEELVDPVCGMTVEAARYVIEHDGVVYRFCCHSCKRMFEEEPKKYVARISS